MGIGGHGYCQHSETIRNNVLRWPWSRNIKSRIGDKMDVIRFCVESHSMPQKPKGEKLGTTSKCQGYDKNIHHIIIVNKNSIVLFSTLRPNQQHQSSITLPIFGAVSSFSVMCTAEPPLLMTNCEANQLPDSATICSISLSLRSDDEVITINWSLLVDKK
jgi:hypothetical protein